MSEGIEILRNIPIYTQGEDELFEIGTLKKGVVIGRISQYGKWQKLDFANKIGFVWEEATKVVDRKFFAPPLYGNLLTLGTCNLYSDTKNDPVGNVLANLEIPIVENVNADWYMTLLAEQHFYVKSKDVKKLP